MFLESCQNISQIYDGDRLIEEKVIDVQVPQFALEVFTFSFFFFSFSRVDHRGQEQSLGL